MNFIKNPCPRGPGYDIAFLDRAHAETVRKYHKTFPQYAVTPLVSLKQTAAHFGVSNIYVKNENARFGLNAFKVLGGSYAIGRVIAERLGVPPEEMTYAVLTDPATRAKTGPLTFITATDGNHGRGVAWTAMTLGYDAYVYMPKGTAPERLDNILATGAHAEITDLIYDDVVRYVRKLSEKNGWILVQDTAWEGYTEVSDRIMQGYLTVTDEAAEQLGGATPTHIFVQAGVGSLAATVAAYYSQRYKEAHPFITVVEPDNAACIFQTARANDGRRHAVTDLNTIQAGLACGEPSLTAWEILRQCADGFMTIPDCVAATGMRILASPMAGDTPIEAGESGASAFGAAIELLRPENEAFRKLAGIDENSVILVINTEGATDRENYRRIVWDGQNCRSAADDG
ncbi:MAG: diaminopropionate ammonia-lyase [Clostridia bacterium]|nr:diaminopropionate ammonia-lyase [Clostridia bacterium]